MQPLPPGGRVLAVPPERKKRSALKYQTVKITAKKNLKLQIRAKNESSMLDSVFC